MMTADVEVEQAGRQFARPPADPLVLAATISPKPDTPAPIATRSPTMTGALSWTTKCAPGFASRVLTSLSTISWTGVPAVTAVAVGTGGTIGAASGTGPTSTACRLSAAASVIIRRRPRASALFDIGCPVGQFAILRGGANMIKIYAGALLLSTMLAVPGSAAPDKPYVVVNEAVGVPVFPNDT